MPIFPTFTFRRSPVAAAREAQGRDLPEDVRQALPMRFEAVGEALAVRARTSSRPARVVGRDVARDGAALGEALSGLRTTYDAGARRAAGLRGRRGAVGGLERRHPGVPPRPVLRGPADRAGQPGARAHPARRGLPRGRADRRLRLRQPRAGDRRAVLPRARRRARAPLHPRAAPGPGDRGDPRGLLRRPDHRPARPGPGGRRGAAHRRPRHLGRAAAGVPRRPRPRRGRRPRLDRGAAPRRPDSATRLLDDLAR